MANIRKTHDTQAKVKISIEAIKGSKTTAELTSTYGVHATQINNWKKAALDIIPEAFSSKRKRIEDDQQALVDERIKKKKCLLNGIILLVPPTNITKGDLREYCHKNH
jgi:transposase